MISLPIFTENMKFFAWSFLNSPKIGRWKSFKKSMHAKRGKKKKREEGVFHRQNGCQKNCIAECYDICFLNICEKHPLVGENCIKSLKKMFDKYLTYFFGCCRMAKYLVYKFTFTFYVFYFFVRHRKMSMINNHSFRPPQMYLEYLDTDKMRG